MKIDVWGKAILTELESELFKQSGAIGLLVFQGNRIAFIKEIKWTDYAESSYVIYAIGNANNRSRKSRMYDTNTGTRIVIDGNRIDYDLIQEL